MSAEQTLIESTDEAFAELKDRVAHALFKLDLDWGNGKFDYTSIRAILTGVNP
jgi:hypothetical protein